MSTNIIATSIQPLDASAYVGPFLGWAGASANSVPVKLLGVLTLPTFASREAECAFEAGDIHGYVMRTLLGFVGLYAAAALYHHFEQRDEVLRRKL